MIRLSYRSPSLRLPSARSFHAALLLLASACGDDDPNPQGAGGSAGGAGVAGNGGGGVAGSAAGAAGGGGSPVSVEPDPLKDCGAPSSPEVPELRLEQVVTGLDDPIYVAQPRGDARLFVVEKPGRIRVVRDGALVGTPFLSIDAVSDRGQEMGLLGLSFHPSYSDNGRFYVYYSTLLGGSNHVSRIAEYRVSSDNADVADPASERVLLEVGQPQDNHNGGNLQFGPDGYLYIGLGDGGGGGDQHGAIGNGQDLGTLLGKILRIDVDGTGAGAMNAYAIPSGNASVAGALPEIWSYGWRNPWRFSFDPCTGDMYIGDVGQGELEEVDFEAAGVSGLNYGWRLMEGTSCFNPDSGCDAAAQNLVLPVATYGRNLGQSITGGYVYRGPLLPNLRGTYLYADYGSARFFALRMQNGSVAQAQVEITANLNPGQDVDAISSFGQDSAGEVYVVSFGGSVYRVVAE
jgi:glucose/arabinose dehydrogenase